jgi:hypothetical protein
VTHAKGSLEKYHHVSCADCGTEKDIEQEKRADAISDLYAARWKQTRDGWVCPICIAKTRADATAV